MVLSEWEQIMVCWVFIRIEDEKGEKKVKGIPTLEQV